MECPISYDFLIIGKWVNYILRQYLYSYPMLWMHIIMSVDHHRRVVDTHRPPVSANIPAVDISTHPVRADMQVGDIHTLAMAVNTLAVGTHTLAMSTDIPVVNTNPLSVDANTLPVSVNMRTDDAHTLVMVINTMPVALELMQIQVKIAVGFTRRQQMVVTLKKGESDENQRVSSSWRSGTVTVVWKFQHPVYDPGGNPGVRRTGKAGSQRQLYRH